MSVGVMKDYKLKQRDLRASHTLEGVPLGVRHLHSENTMVHTSTFRNYKVSSEKKKYLYHLQKASVPHSGFLRKGVVFP